VITEWLERDASMMGYRCGRMRFQGILKLHRNGSNYAGALKMSAAGPTMVHDVRHGLAARALF
jgi:hypothetical protein